MKELNADDDVQLYLEVSGAACSGSHENLPRIASWPQPDPWDDFAIDSSLGKHLLLGLPLVCCVRIALSISKECCVVQPLHSIRCNDRCLFVESLTSASSV